MTRLPLLCVYMLALRCASWIVPGDERERMAEGMEG